MKTLAVVFALALAAIAFEVYSDASLTSADFFHTKTSDPAAVAIAHGYNAGRARKPAREGLAIPAALKIEN
jgi:hypothetical protein